MAVIGVAQALERCARELADLTAACERLQDHISPLLRRGEDLEKAQSLDLITQSLAGLSEYLATLALDMPADARVDAAHAAAGLTLEALASRLAGGEPPAPQDDDSAFDFFGSA